MNSIPLLDQNSFLKIALKYVLRFVWIKIVVYLMPDKIIWVFISLFRVRCGAVVKIL